MGYTGPCSIAWKTRHGSWPGWERYFTERLGYPIPTSLECFTREAGFANVDELTRAMLREYCYLQESLENTAGSPS